MMSGKVGSSLGQRCQPMLAPGTPSPGNLAPAHPAPSTQPFSPADTCLGSRRESSRRHRILELLRATRNGLSTPPKLLHPLAGSSLMAWWESWPRHGRRKRQRIGVCPMGQTDDAAWAEEKLLQSSAICCSSQFPALCLSFPIHRVMAMVGAACKAFCFESCCRKMFYPHKELLKAAACPSPCPARCPWIPPQDGSHPGFISSAAAVSGLCCLSSHSCSTPHLCSCLKHFLNAPLTQRASSAPDLRDAPG